jgi:hypothetical protein
LQSFYFAKPSQTYSTISNYLRGGLRRREGGAREKCRMERRVGEGREMVGKHTHNSFTLVLICGLCTKSRYLGYHDIILSSIFKIPKEQLHTRNSLFHANRVRLITTMSNTTRRTRVHLCTRRFKCSFAQLRNARNARHARTATSRCARYITNMSG